MGVIESESEARFKAKREAILEHATPELKQAVIAAKGASSWVTASPSYSAAQARLRGLLLHALRMDPSGSPDLLRACGNAFNVQHALDCKLGVF